MRAFGFCVYGVAFVRAFGVCVYGIVLVYAFGVAVARGGDPAARPVPRWTVEVPAPA